MPDKSNVGATLIILLVVAGVIVLVGWFVWSYKTTKPVPTSPKATTRLVIPNGGGLGGIQTVNLA